MAFRTTVGQEYKAKNRFDSFLESQEEAARTQSRVTSSLAHNAVQAGVLVNHCTADAATRPFVMTQQRVRWCDGLMRFGLMSAARATCTMQASDAMARGMHKGWVMAQKGAWAVKQMQLEADLASSGMQQGMQVRVNQSKPPVIRNDSGLLSSRQRLIEQGGLADSGTGPTSGNLGDRPAAPAAHIAASV